MLKHCLRKFAYVPKQKLTFIDGKSLIMEEKIIGSIEKSLKISWGVVFSFSYLISDNSHDVALNVGLSMIPFFGFHANLILAKMFCVKKLYLDEDGKNIWVQTYFSETLNKVKIAKLEFEEMKKFKRFNPMLKIIVISSNASAYISKSSEIYYKDVLDKILECKEIQVGIPNK
ncbi:hypothetical protein SteCoe_6269 [Stentor coeruleus]|uniref:Uncharacterized protein n=1 Tax=Stentor coeruleus TaxID=5963 RepID=A0A1R2CQC4_9CILI|nr:hypothetical protein SteCoe_6269 [Stentor coeruleus]